MKATLLLIAFIFASATGFAKFRPADLVLNYSTDSYQLSEQHQQSLDQFPATIHPDVALIVCVGGTDADASDLYNMKLSEYRAKTAEGYLQTMVSLKTTSIAYGEAHPVSENNSEEGKAANRRVEIYALKRNEVADFYQHMRPWCKTNLIEMLPPVQVPQPTPGRTEVLLASNTYIGWDLQDVEVEVKEAITPQQIIDNQAWPVTSDGQPLESAGMINICGTAPDGEILNVDPGAEVTVRFPADEYVPGMKLYNVNDTEEGMRWDEGDVDAVWNESEKYYELTIPVQNCSWINLDSPCKMSDGYVMPTFARHRTFLYNDEVKGYLELGPYNDSVWYQCLKGTRPDHQAYTRLVDSAWTDEGEVYLASVNIDDLALIETPTFKTAHQVDRASYRYVPPQPKVEKTVYQVTYSDTVLKLKVPGLRNATAGIYITEGDTLLSLSPKGSRLFTSDLIKAEDLRLVAEGSHKRKEGVTYSTEVPFAGLKKRYNPKTGTMTIRLKRSDFIRRKD